MTTINNADPPLSPLLHRPIHFIEGPLPTISVDRFLVTWRDPETGNKVALGDLSSSDATRPTTTTAAAAKTATNNNNNNKPELHFRVAFDSGRGLFMLYFYHPLKMRAASKGIRDVYLVVSGESLRRPDGLVLTGPQQRLTDDDHGDGDGDGDGGDELLNLAVTLSWPACVFMPTAGAKRPLSTQARGCLLALKSLSQAREFEVALPRERRLEDVLRGVRGWKDGTMLLQSPRIDFEKTFSGRAWDEGVWQKYLLGEGERLQGEWNPILQEEPPRYEDVVAGDAVEAGCGAEMGEGEEEGDGEQLGDRERLGGGERFRGEKERGLLPDTATAAFPPPLPTAFKAHDQTQQQQTPGAFNRPAALKRKAASPPPASPPHHPKPAPRQTHQATPPSRNPLPTAVLLSALQAHLSPPNPPGSLATFLPLPPRSQSVLHLGRSRSLFSDAQYARFFNGVAWLAALWPRLLPPPGHRHGGHTGDAQLLARLLPHAGRMMQCVREAAWERFAEQRVAAMAAALALCQSASSSTPAPGGGGGGGGGKEEEEEEEEDARSRPREKRRRKKAPTAAAAPPPPPSFGTVSPLAVPPTRAGAALAGFIYARIGEGVDAFIVDDLLALQEVAALLERAAAAAAGGEHGVGRQEGRGRRRPGAAGVEAPDLAQASDDAVHELERQAVAFTWQLAACVMLALYKAHERDWFARDGGGVERMEADVSV